MQILIHGERFLLLLLGENRHISRCKGLKGVRNDK